MTSRGRSGRWQVIPREKYLQVCFLFASLESMPCGLHIGYTCHPLVAFLPRLTDNHLLSPTHGPPDYLTLRAFDLLNVRHTGNRGDGFVQLSAYQPRKLKPLVLLFLMSHADHGSTSAALPATGGHEGMTPYLHFTGGDYLYFPAWVPTTPGAIAGACVGLFFLALFERWFAALRGVFENHWRHR